jgi:hypothetical protein
MDVQVVEYEEDMTLKLNDESTEESPNLKELHGLKGAQLLMAIAKNIKKLCSIFKMGKVIETFNSVLTDLHLVEEISKKYNR